MFAFVIYDIKEKKYTAIRDRFGIKPLYFSYLNDADILFSSEIKPLISLRNQKPLINFDILIDFLNEGFIDHSSSTFFKRIYKLNPGEYVEASLESKTIKKVIWFNLFDEFLKCKEDTKNLSILDKLNKLEDNLLEVVNESLISDFKVAINLSNGIDSALLQLIISKLGYDFESYTQFYSKNIDPKSIYSPKEIYNKRKLIKISAEDIYASIYETHFYQEEPYSGLFIDGYSKLYETARNDGNRVFLDANGLDEFFLGYDKYRLGKYPINLGPQSIDGTYDNKNLYTNDLFNLRSCRNNLPQRINSVKEHSLYDLRSFKIPRGLRFNDKVSMRHSCELRVPFLDHRILNISNLFTDKELQNKNIGKLPIRKILSKYSNKNFAFNNKNHKQSSQTELLSTALYEILNESINN